jgi:hypothetical protein
VGVPARIEGGSVGRRRGAGGWGGAGAAGDAARSARDGGDRR